ncbi:hypothetical protein GCM10010178_40170 [Lentzea flava]|uniref:Uncharacterized protein n=1 Tax=Lentzea flava TaxID=103732 RepID=A0ABQ2ULF6_9PSEU|nr:hypothetical protein GCM10010178_40170 [Lentzea flava]
MEREGPSYRSKLAAGDDGDEVSRSEITRRRASSALRRRPAYLKVSYNGLNPALEPRSRGMSRTVSGVSG